MNIEAGFIGFLLANTEEIDNARISVTPEMITNVYYRDIYKEMLRGNDTLVGLNGTLKDDIEDFTAIINGCIADYVGDPLSEYVKVIRKEYRLNKTKAILMDAVKRLDRNNVDNLLDALTDELDDVKPVKKSRATKLKDLAKYITEYFKPHEDRFDFGFKNIDRFTGGVDKGDMCVIAARPAVGKTAFALNVIWNNPKMKCGYFNLEMTDQQIYERWVCAFSGIDIGHLRRAERANNDEQKRLEDATEQIRNNDNTLIFTGSISVKEIYQQCKIEKFDYIIVDYLQLIEPDGGRGSNRAAEVGDISRGLKKIATKFNIPVIALSQLNRASEATKDKEPSMSEIRESGAIEQDASIIIILWKNDETNKRNVKVEKARMGIPGKTELYFDGAHMKFTEQQGFIKTDGDIPFK